MDLRKLRRRANRYDNLWAWDSIVCLLERIAHIFGDRPSNQKAVSMAWGGDELNTKAPAGRRRSY